MYRKISNCIEEYLTGNEEKILCIDGARQVGKSYIIRELAQRHFENYIEINMADDLEKPKAVIGRSDKRVYKFLCKKVYK